MENNAVIVMTLSVAVAVGVGLVVLARHSRLPAIVLLLAGGVAIGPAGLGVIAPDQLEQGLQAVVAMAVALILFEGGLTLDLQGYRKASREIRGLLTLGVLITWLGSAAIVYLLFGYSIEFSLLAGSLIIVTGPTVIGPLLNSTGVKRKLHHILHWEGVLIDPIGVFIALLCYEWLAHEGNGAMAMFLGRFVVGLGAGAAGGWLLAFILRRGWVPEEQQNIFAVAAALLLFSVSDHIIAESGLLSVTVAGLVAGYFAKHQMESIKRYKAELTDLLIGLLFVLLAANLELDSFWQSGIEVVWAVLLVMFVVRPLNVFVSMFSSPLGLKDKLFLSWVAPRGIVAASMASLFAISLEAGPGNDPGFLETFTYSVIVGTVVLQGMTFGVVGRLLDVAMPEPDGWLVVGAHSLGRRVALFLQSQGIPVVIMDQNGHLVARARRDGLLALCADPLVEEPDLTPELYGVGFVLAASKNRDLNVLVCQRWKYMLRRAALYRWGKPAGDQGGEMHYVGNSIWSALNPDLVSDVETESDSPYTVDQGTSSVVTTHPERVLLSVQGGRVFPGLPEQVAEDCMVLRYDPLPAVLEVPTQPHWVRVSHADSVEAAIQELLSCLAQDFPGLDVPGLTRQLSRQEEEYSSIIGYNVALPHAYTDGVPQSVVSIAKLEHPVVCGRTGQKVDVIFLLLSPQGQARLHLKALAEISRFIMAEDNRRMLMQAETTEQLHKVLFP